VQRASTSYIDPATARRGRRTRISARIIGDDGKDRKGFPTSRHVYDPFSYNVLLKLDVCETGGVVNTIKDVQLLDPDPQPLRHLVKQDC